MTLNLNRFDLTSLRLYVMVVNTGSLTLGADQFGISLAAASKRIAELEARLGQTLLSRGKKGVTPTPAGETLHRHALELVGRLEQLSVAMNDFHQGTHGHLRIWANASAFAQFLPRVLSVYTVRHPDIRIELEDALSEDAARAVVAGTAELAVIAENTRTEGLQTIPCEDDELVLITPPGHPLGGRARVELNDILGHELVGMNRSTSLMQQIHSMASALGRPMKLRVQVRGFDAMCKMVSAGVGVALIPHTCALPHAPALGLGLSRIEGPWTRRRLLLAMRERRHLSPAAQAFVALVENAEDRA